MKNRIDPMEFLGMFTTLENVGTQDLARYSRYNFKRVSFTDTIFRYTTVQILHWKRRAHCNTKGKK